MTVFRFRPRLSNGATITEPMVWFAFEKPMSEHSHNSRIIEQAALDIHDGIVFRLIIPQNGIEG